MWPDMKSKDYKTFKGLIDFGPKSLFLGKNRIKNVRFLEIEIKFRNDYGFIKSGKCKYLTSYGTVVKTLNYGYEAAQGDLLYLVK